MIRIEGTSEKHDVYSIWKLYHDDVMICCFYGPMSAACAGIVAEAMINGKEMSALSILPFNKWS